MQSRTYQYIQRTALIVSILFVVVPPFFFHKNPNPNVALIGWYGIPVKGLQKGGYPLYIFWIDFVIAAVLCLLLAWFTRHKSRHN